MFSVMFSLRLRRISRKHPLFFCCVAWQQFSRSHTSISVNDTETTITLLVPLYSPRIFACTHVWSLFWHVHCEKFSFCVWAGCRWAVPHHETYGQEHEVLALAFSSAWWLHLVVSCPIPTFSSEHVSLTHTHAHGACNIPLRNNIQNLLRLIEQLLAITQTCHPIMFPSKGEIFHFKQLNNMHMIQPIGLQSQNTSRKQGNVHIS